MSVLWSYLILSRSHQSLQRHFWSERRCTCSTNQVYMQAPQPSWYCMYCVHMALHLSVVSIMATKTVCPSPLPLPPSPFSIAQFSPCPHLSFFLSLSCQCLHSQPLHAFLLTPKLTVLHYQFIVWVNKHDCYLSSCYWTSKLQILLVRSFLPQQFCSSF